MVPLHGTPIRRLGQTRCAELQGGGSREDGSYGPHAQHVDKVLLRYIILLVNIALQCGEDVALMEQVVATLALQIEEGLVRYPVAICDRAAILRRDRKVLKLFAEYNNSLLGQEGVLGWRRPKVRRRGTAVSEMLLSSE